MGLLYDLYSMITSHHKHHWGTTFILNALRFLNSWVVVVFPKHGLLFYIFLVGLSSSFLQKMYRFISNSENDMLHSIGTWWYLVLSFQQTHSCLPSRGQQKSHTTTTILIASWDLLPCS
jgi:hypothetical protein